MRRVFGQYLERRSALRKLRDRYHELGILEHRIDVYENSVFPLQSCGLLRCISYPFHVIRVGISIKRAHPASFVIAVRRLAEMFVRNICGDLGAANVAAKRPA